MIKNPRASLRYAPGRSAAESGDSFIDSTIATPHDIVVPVPTRYDLPVIRVSILSVLLFATAAPGAEPDLSTPKQAARTLFNAISAGDRDAVRASLYADTDARRELASAMADLIVAGKKLGDTAHAKFGAAGDPIGRGMLDPSDLSKLEAAVAKESGDAATIEVPGQPRPMSFRRQDGKWKLVVTDFGGAAPENIGKQTKLVRLIGDAVATAANDVDSGKYKTAEEATYAIQQSLHHAMLTFTRPATIRAATQSTTTTTTTQPAK
jgi:hypothetical protein